MNYKILFRSVLASVLTLVACSGEESQPVQNFPSISVAKWLGNAPSALSFVWDDTNPQHYNIIGPMFDKYGYRASFSVVTSVLVKFPEYTAGYRTVLDRGHELCSHTHTHMRLNTVGITEETIRYELSTSKNTIINLFGISPRCFAYPGNAFITGMEFSSDYYLWTRTHNLNQDTENFVANIVTDTGLSRLMYIYSLNVNSKNWVTFAGHGVDGGSYEPLSSKDLDDFLSYLKNQPVWIDTESNVALYNEIRRLISVESIAGSSIAIDDSKIDYGRYSAFGNTQYPYYGDSIFFAAT